MTFKKCPHTCLHVTKKTRSGIFWSSGGAFNTHLKSESAHKHCNKDCPAFQNPNAPCPPITDDIWVEYADETFTRYSENADVIRYIPIQHLSNEKHREAHPDYKLFMDKQHKKQEREVAPTSREPSRGEMSLPPQHPAPRKGTIPAPAIVGREQSRTKTSSARSEQPPQAHRSARPEQLPQAHRSAHPEQPPQAHRSAHPEQPPQAHRSAHPEQPPQAHRSAHRFTTSPPQSRSPSPPRRSISPIDYADPEQGASAAPSTSRRPSRDIAHPSPHPPSLHFYRGAFPEQQVAMNSPFYQREISVLVVEDPGMVSSPEAAHEDLWMMPSRDYIPADWLDLVKRRWPKHVIHLEDQEDSLVWEWLLVYYALETASGGPCKMEFMRWQDYKQAVLQGRGKHWEQMKSKDLVIGGLPLTVDFMDEDGFDHHQLPTVWANIRALCFFTTVFPSPDQMIWHGHKLATVRELSFIAQQYTKTPYPIITPIQNPSSIDLRNRRNLYVKRDFSESSQHVLKVTSDLDFAKEFKKQVKETKMRYDHDSIRQMGINVQWFGMSYVDGLQSLGELRVFLVGGEISHTVLTRMEDDDNMMEWAVANFTPLQLLEELYARRAKKGDVNLRLANPMAPKHVVARALEEFTFFVTTTYKKLVEIEENNFGTGRSDLRVLCRLDISALLDRSGRVSYFVNEVTDPGRMALFLRTATTPSGYALNIAIALRTKIALRRSVKLEQTK